MSDLKAGFWSLDRSTACMMLWSRIRVVIFAFMGARYSQTSLTPCRLIEFRSSWAAASFFVFRAYLAGVSKTRKGASRIWQYWSICPITE